MLFEKFDVENRMGGASSSMLRPFLIHPPADTQILERLSFPGLSYNIAATFVAKGCKLA